MLLSPSFLEGGRCACGSECSLEIEQHGLSSDSEEVEASMRYVVDDVVRLNFRVVLEDEVVDPNGVLSRIVLRRSHRHA